MSVLERTIAFAGYEVAKAVRLGHSAGDHEIAEVRVLTAPTLLTGM
jgi:hypothetical protein